MNASNITDRDAGEASNDTRIAQADARTDQANTRTQQADVRTDQANTRTDEANVRTKEANTRTDQANTRTATAEHSEQALRASELSYRRLFEAARDGILILDVDTGRITDANPFLIELLGFSHGEMVGKTVGELSPFKDILSNQTMLDRLRKDGYIRYEDLPLETRDGRHIAVEFVSNVYQAGDVKVIQCNIRDVTDRKAAEEARRVSEAEFHTLAEAMPQIVWVTNAAGGNIYFNKRWMDYTGLTLEESLGDGWNKPFHPEDQQRAWDTWQKAVAGTGDYSLECRLRRADGIYRWWWILGAPFKADDGSILKWFGTCTDITEHKLAETALLESKRFLRSTLDALSSHIAILDERGTIIEVNAAWKRFAKENNFMGSECGVADNYLQVCDSATGNFSAEAPTVAKGIRTIISGPHSVFTLEYPCHSRDEQRWFILRVTRFDSDGPVRVVVAHENITERKRVEARFRRLVDSNAQGVIFWNTKGQITEANDAFLKLTGYTRADLVTGPIDWVAMTPPEYTDLDQRALKQIADTGVCVPFEKEYIRKDGKLVPILIGAAAFEDAPNEGVCFVLDLTERKKLEHQFRQSQKMESFGQLAGGVAHDFNNILAVVQMQTDLFLDDSRLTPEQLDCIEQIRESTTRATALTRQLLLFSRKETMQPRELDLNESINGITNMLRRILGEHIEIQFKFSLQPLFLHADAGMIDQVLLNLAVNSRDAMPKGGRLVIETSAVDFDELVHEQSAQARPGSFVCLTVSDSGCGIPPENLSRVFEPFFTTKGVGKGTGLGLATVFGIVQQHRGWVNVYSEVGQGTTFRIYLPRLAMMSAAPHKAEPSKMAKLPGGTETILLVEDDDFVRPSVCNALSRLGYRVLAVSNAVKALEIWQYRADEIDLVLTDLVMPGGISGRDLGERLLRERPKLKVIYASGYSAEIVTKDFLVEEGVNFLTKPFQAQKLAQTIRQSLDTRDLAA